MLGSGTVGDPYIIQTATDFQNINLDLTAYYELGNDIDASGGPDFTIIGTGIAQFSGSLDGKRYKVTGLHMTVAFAIASVFYTIKGVVKNIGFENVNLVSTSMSASGFCFANMGTISNSYCTGIVTGGQAGVAAAGFAYVNNSTLGPGIITDCYSTCTVTSLNPAPAAGFCGWNGYFTPGTLINCYFAGVLVGASIMGFCGVNLVGSTITSCYWDTDVSGTLVSDGGTGKTTILMKQQATFIGWDFTVIPIWYITETVTYPTFSTYIPPVPPYQSPPCIIDFKGLLDCIGWKWRVGGI